MLRDLAIPDFLDKLNSSEPTPGGGGCAALNGAIAAGLIQMVCNVTTNKMLKKEQPVDKELVQKIGYCQISQHFKSPFPLLYIFAPVKSIEIQPPTGLTAPAPQA